MSTNNNNKSSLMGWVTIICITILIYTLCCGNSGGSRGYDPHDDPDYDRVYNGIKYGVWD